MNLRALVVDDELPAREQLKRHLARVRTIDCVGEASDGKSALAMIQTLQPDIVFIDIHMPEMDGLEVASACRAPLPLFVFVTAFDHYAVRAFELNALDYLLKPFDPARFQQTVARLLSEPAALRVNANKTQQMVTVARDVVPKLLLPMDDQWVPVAVDEVIRIEAAKDWVALVVRGEQVIIRRTLTAILALLGVDFVQVHRSHGVNVNAVASLQNLGKGDYQLTMTNGDFVRLSRRYADHCLVRFGRLLRV